MTRTKISNLEFLAGKDDPAKFFQLVMPYISEQQRRLLRIPLNTLEYNEIKKALQQAEMLLTGTKIRMKSRNQKEKF